MIRFPIAASAAAAISLASAQAQQIGRYDGTSADGQSISLTVANDAGTGHLEIVSVTVAYFAKCNQGETTQASATWAPNVDLAGGNTDIKYFNGNIAINFLVQFPDASTATGGLATRAAIWRYTNRPIITDLCVSPWQRFTLTYAGN